VGEFEGVVGAGDLGIDHEGTDADSDGRIIKRQVVREETTEVLREPHPTPSEADVSKLMQLDCIFFDDPELGQGRPWRI
jgi:hypothetical protein